MPRFYDDKAATLDQDLYFEVFEKKGVKFLRIRRTKDFSDLSGLQLEVLEEHIWTQGDSFWKLAQKYYNNVSLWWTISMVNKKPTDGHCNIGDVIMIPRDAYRIAEAMR
jgi:nucleoid-associated protein YgaU